MNYSGFHCILIILIFYYSFFDLHQNVKYIVQGPINTLLILLIIGFMLKEDTKSGFLLMVAYLILLTKNKETNEYFKSISGPSPLSCNTFIKNSRNSQYPLNY